MTDQVYFVIPGKVQAKQSVKVGRGGRFFTDPVMVNYANQVKDCAYRAMDGNDLIEGMIECILYVYLPIQKSLSKKKRKARLSGYEMAEVKPDWDNIGKNICDACEGIVYAKDQAITAAHVYKYYSEKPRVEVTFRKTNGHEHF